MFGKNDDTEKSRRQNRHNPATTNIRIYPLESVMGLQKALENGIEEEKLPHKRPRLGQYRRPNGQIVPVNLILRLRNSLAAMAARLAYGIQSVFARKKQFRRTSAR